ncbi:MAG: M48 family metallopeptidase [Verrucomicrobia bacterium]|nr:M48 family metallopeptidase [Verrucomicrobiota bacterium]
MNLPTLIALLAAVLVLARWGMELWLGWLNERHVRSHAGEVPAAFKDMIDDATYAKSVHYTLDRIRLGRVTDSYDTVILLAAVFSGVLPWAFDLFVRWRGDSAWSLAAFLLLAGAALSLTGVPFAWYEQFKLEERHGFNTMTLRLWLTDRLKAVVLAVALGYPLLVLVLYLVRRTGPTWWLWAWGILLAFQLLMLVLAPVLILPLFNKFTPLPPGPLRDRLLALAARTRFRAQSIQVMDGSKRSRHSNAFFTGFGRFRKIVLFDTLLQQLTEPELEAVLAHEIGHYRLKHIPKMLLASASALFAALGVLAWLAQQEWFYHAFGFLPGTIEPAILLFGLLSGAVTFWFSPLAHLWSRRFEYQADAFAASAVNGPPALISALRKLNEKNLSNLTPHPLYSGFYYSHPTLIEREQALA